MASATGIEIAGVRTTSRFLEERINSERLLSLATVMAC
jgi:hypothetical protein